MQDQPHAGVETEMLATKEARMRALPGRCVIVDGAYAVVVKAYGADVVNVVRVDTLEPMMSVQRWTSAFPLVCPVFYRHANGYQYVALVTRIDETSEVDLVVLSDGYVDLGGGPGVPVGREHVPHGVGCECWWAEEIDA